MTRRVNDRKGQDGAPFFSLALLIWMHGQAQEEASIFIHFLVISISILWRLARRKAALLLVMSDGMDGWMDGMEWNGMGIF